MFVLIAVSAVPARSEPVTIDFTGTVDLFNYGPLTPTSAIVGQIVLDDTIVPYGVNNRFDNVVLSFSLTVFEPGGPVSFTSTGSGGRVQQFTGGATEFVGISYGETSGGTISGSVGGVGLLSFGIDFRGSDLFDDPTILATGLTEADIGYRYLALNFDIAGSAGLAVERSLDTVVFSGIPQGSAVPAPPAAWGLVAGVAFMAVRRRIGSC